MIPRNFNYDIEDPNFGIPPQKLGGTIEDAPAPGLQSSFDSVVQPQTVQAGNVIVPLIIPTGGHIRSGQTAYDTGTGFFLGDDGGTPKLSIGDSTDAAKSITWDGSTLEIGGVPAFGGAVFGGDGSDGALSSSSGTTTIDLGNAAVVERNYTSISLTGTADLAFSNPHTNGSIVILRSQGAVTITSSTTPAIDGDALGAAGGAAVAPTNDGNNGSDGIWHSTSDHGNGALTGGSGTVGAGGTAPLSSTITDRIEDKLYDLLLIPGAGGGSGAAAGSDNSGAGGRGGIALLIECAGALNFTSTVYSRGAAGSAAAGTGSGAGGGGGGGVFYIVANSVTANTGTITVTGGTGGVTGGTTFRGAGGGSSAINDGDAGSNNNGGDGGDGLGAVITRT